MTRDPAIDAAIARLQAALADVANGDVRAIKALYEHSDDATSFYGWGGFEHGWHEVDRRWDWAGRQFKGGKVSWQPLTRIASGDLFYMTDIETFRCLMDGAAEPATWSNRVTHVFRRTDGAWRLIHRHANRLEGQYQPAERLCGGTGGGRSGS
jgi:ketosteroid isomerase-like protein